MESSCISWPEKERLVIIRASQVLLCDGDHCAAALLSFFTRGHDYKLDARREATHRNKVAQQHGEEGTQDTSLLQYRTEEELRTGLLGLYGASTIRKALALLVKKGFLSIQHNPNPRYRFDRTHYFLFHPEEVSAQLLEIAHPVKLPDRDVENNAPSVESNASCVKNGATITKLTPKLTDQEEDPPLRPPKGERYSKGFVMFWDIYPRKVAKDKAWQVWRRRGLELLVTEICASVQSHMARDPQWGEPRYIPHPTSFLNGGYWQDDVPERSRASRTDQYDLSAWAAEEDAS